MHRARRCDYRRDMARMLADSCLAKLHSKGTQALAERTLVEMALPPVVCAGCPQCAAGKRLWATQIRDGFDSCHRAQLLDRATVSSDGVQAEAIEDIARDGEQATASDGVLAAATGGGEAQVVGQCACTGDGNYCTALGHESRGHRCTSRATQGQYCDECVCVCVMLMVVNGAANGLHTAGSTGI